MLTILLSPQAFLDYLPQLGFLSEIWKRKSFSAFKTKVLEVNFGELTFQVVIKES
ncbi:unnamed protein product, partial [Nesidiocoris tenuis]